MKYIAMPFLAFVMAATFCPRAVAQAAVEYGMGAGLATTSTAPAHALGKQIGGVFNTLNQVMEPDRNAPSAGSTQLKFKPSVLSRQSTRPLKKNLAVARAVPAAQPTPAYEDPRQIQAGIAYDEIIRRFGPPSMAATTAPGRTTLWYARRDANYQIEVEEGKVTSIAGANSQ